MGRCGNRTRSWDKCMHKCMISCRYFKGVEGFIISSTRHRVTFFTFEILQIDQFNILVAVWTNLMISSYFNCVEKWFGRINAYFLKKIFIITLFLNIVSSHKSNDLIVTFARRMLSWFGRTNVYVLKRLATL